MLKGAIFDMDGVLLDSHPAHERAWRKVLSSMGKPVSEAQLEIIREGRKRHEILERVLGDLTSDEICRCCSEKDLLFQKEAQNIRTIAGVRGLLGDLKSSAIRTAVASCGSRARVNRLLDSLQLKTCFVTVLTGDDVTLGKPDPEIFLKAGEHMRLRPSEIVVFEDSTSGVLAATAAGMKCIGIGASQRARALFEAGAAHVIPDFVGASLIRLRRWFSLAPRHHSYETPSNSAGIPQQTVTDLETR